MSVNPLKLCQPLTLNQNTFGEQANTSRKAKKKERETVREQNN